MTLFVVGLALASVTWSEETEPEVESGFERNQWPLDDLTGT